jgi:superfamily II DNA or RNA helicase
MNGWLDAQEEGKWESRQARRTAERAFLRDYQLRAVEDVCLAARRGERRITVCQPVGTGKTEVICELFRIAKYPLLLVPLLDLMRQGRDRLEMRLGERCDIEQGGNYAESVEGLRNRVIVASRDSMLSAGRYRSRAFDRVSLICVDECHVKITPAMEQMLCHFESRGATIVGFSATPYKGKGKGLRFFPRPQSVYTLRQALDDAYLVPPRCHVSEATSLDMTLVDEVAGEWDEKQLAAVLAAEHYAQEVTSLVLSTYRGQPSVVYAHCVRQAKLLADVFARYGTKVSIVYSKQNPLVRRDNMKAFVEGETKIIVNVGILGYGWDFPELRNIYSAAPTRQLHVLEQRLGRGTRTLTGTLHHEMTLDERIAAIKASAKPFFNYYDITGTIRQQQILSVYDVLDAKLRKSASRKSRLDATLTSEGTDVMEAIREADAVDLAELEAQTAALMEKRKNLIVGVTFEHGDRDVFAEPEGQPKRRGWRMMYGKYRGVPLADIPQGYLSWVLSSQKKASPFSMAVQKELSRRENQQPR